MKLEPIFNPHARIGQIKNKTKAEEKDELIASTKAQVLDKYMTTKKSTKRAGETAAKSGASGFESK